jgi:predicted enzyme related to lactoylglutathione lyase
MDHTVVHFEIPADDPERAAKFYGELFGWDISRFNGPTGGDGPEYWLVRTIPSDATGHPTRPGVNGGLMRRMSPGSLVITSVASVDELSTRQCRRVCVECPVREWGSPSSRTRGQRSRSGADSAAA